MRRNLTLRDIISDVFCNFVGNEVVVDELDAKVREILAVDGFGDILKESGSCNEHADKL